MTVRRETARSLAGLCRWVTCGALRGEGVARVYVPPQPYICGRNAAKRARRERARAQRATELRLRKASRRNVRRWARRCEAQPELILEGPGSPRGAA